MKKIHAQRRQGDSASILLEAVIAATIALSALAAIAPLFALQIDLTKRARDTNLIEAAVNEDINNVRQYASYYKTVSSPYSSNIQKPAISQTCINSSESRITLVDTYSNPGCNKPLGGECTLLLPNFRSDLPNYKFVPNSTNSITTIKDFGNIVPGYVLTRTVTTFNSTVATGMPSDGRTSLRMTYSLAPIGTAPPLAFSRTADVVLNAQYGC